MQKHMNIVVTDTYADELLKDLAEKTLLKFFHRMMAFLKIMKFLNGKKQKYKGG